MPVDTVNIGSKDRKPGLYGATFFQDENNETKIAVARPGFRIWFVAMDGSVRVALFQTQIMFLQLMYYLMY